MIILTVISSVTTFYLTISTAYSQPLSDNTYGAYGGVGSVTGIISFLTGIITLYWYYRATLNIHSFGAKDVTSPTMAAIWWIVPIFFFWKPYHVTQQIWKTSNPELNLTEGIEWIKSPSSKLIKQWWTLFLVSIAGTVLGTIIGYSTNLLFLENLLAIPFEVVGIISTILFIRIIRQISTRQEFKHSNLTGHTLV
jgi:hypothetical protein